MKTKHFVEYRLLPMLFPGSGEPKVTLHVLGLLKDILGVFPKRRLKSTCETILGLIAQANIVSRAVYYSPYISSLPVVI